MPLYNFRTDLESLRKEMGKPFQGITSGITTLDTQITGFANGDLSIIAGRPGLGKSSLARNILLHNYKSDLKNGVGMLFTMEMKALEVSNLMAATLAEINYEEIRNGLATQNTIDKFNKTAQELQDYNIFIQDNSFITPDTMRQDINYVIKESDKKITCIAVDYLQLMTLKKAVESRQLEVSEISRELKAISTDYDVPVIALAQLNRNVEYRESSRPKLIDLRDTGSLEQDASTVILIHRPGYYHKQENPDMEDDGEVELIVAKMRYGNQGIAKCGFIGEYTSFFDIPLD